jgi:uncharacterized repeat protein (TIGR01451 family)
MMETKLFSLSARLSRLSSVSLAFGRHLRLLTALAAALVLTVAGVQQAGAVPRLPTAPTGATVAWQTAPHRVFVPVAQGAGAVTANDLRAAAAVNPCSSESLITWLDVLPGWPLSLFEVNLTNNIEPKSFPIPLGELTFGDGTKADVYCTDIYHDATSNEPYCLDQDFFADWRVAWFVANFPPSRSSYFEHAARQSVVWWLTDGYDLQGDPTSLPARSGGTPGAQDDDGDFVERVAALKALIPANPPAEYAPGNVEMVIDPAVVTNVLPTQPAHPFTVRLTKGGTPLVGVQVTVQASAGALNTFTGTTNISGVASFTLTSHVTATAQITATAGVTLPAGSRFVNKNSPATLQRLVLATPKFTTVQAVGSKRWISNTNVIIAHKFNDLNLNGVQDGGEPSLSGWNMTLRVPAGQTYTATTDSAGNAFFEGRIAGNGSYLITETLQSGWVNSTPLTQSNSRTVTNTWTSWTASFGNAQNALLTVVKFLDQDGDGVKDGGEPQLTGWQFLLSDKVAGSFQQLEGCTTATTTVAGTGSCGFTALAAGEYRVSENLQPGYATSTGLDQIVTLGALSSTILYFGNYQPATLIIEKVSVNGTGSFTFTTSGPISGSFGLNTANAQSRQSITFTNLAPGTLVVTETQAPANFLLTGLTCSDGNSTANGSTATIRLESGETVKCTYTNTRYTPAVAIGKVCPANVFAGDPIPYTIAITNSGSATLTNVLVNDPLAGLSDIIGQFNPGATKRYTPTITAGAPALIQNSATITGGFTSSVVTATALCNTRIWEVGVSKSASTTYTRTFAWDIQKSAVPTTVALFDGQSTVVTYTVQLTKTALADGGVVTGSIVISNPSPLSATIAAITDTLPGATGMTVVCPGAVPFALGALQAVTCTYAGTVITSANVINRVDVVRAGRVISATAAVAFTPPASPLLNTVNVTDSNVAGANWSFSASGSQPYTTTVDCQNASYKFGVTGSKTISNTAVITQTGQQDTAEVHIGCYRLSVTKTANTTVLHDYEWRIGKTVSPTQLHLFDGDSRPLTWTVTVTKTQLPDVNLVTGTIFVRNYAPMAAELLTVTDQLADGAVALVQCPTLTIVGSSIISCVYTVTAISPAVQFNTAVARQNLGNGLTHQYTGTTSVVFGGAPVVELNGTVTVTDTNLPGVATGFSSSGNWIYSLPQNCSNITFGAAGSGSKSIANTAVITQTHQSAVAFAQINCYRLAVSKNATTAYTLTYGWAITKSVAPARLDLFDGESRPLTFTVAVTRDNGSESQHRVHGTIVISNPAPMAAMLVNVTDTLPTAGGVAVTCPALTVAANSVLSCSYSATLPNKTPQTNRATAVQQVNVTVTRSYSGTAAVTFGAPATVLSASVTLSDTNWAQAQLVSGTMNVVYPVVQNCSGIDFTGTLTGSKVVTNTARLVGLTGKSATTTAAIHCYRLAVSKSATPAAVITYTWAISKSVSPAGFDLTAGQSATATYRVSVTKAVAATGFGVTGAIVISNPAPMAAQLAGVSDQMSDGLPATVTCGGATGVAPGSTLTCTYGASLPSGAARTNVATAVQALSGGGTRSYSGTAPIVFGQPIEILPAVTVSDTQWVTSTLTSGTTSYSYPVPFSCVDINFNGQASFSTSRLNVASLKETGQQVQVSVPLVCRANGGLTVTKVVITNGVTIPAEQRYTLCVAGPSYPTGGESGACQNFPPAGGSLGWSNLIPGSYTVNETGVAPLTNFTVSGSGQVVAVAGSGISSAVITNTAICPENGISGVIFRDFNSDNVRQQGEPVFVDVDEVRSEVTVFLESTDGAIRLAQTTVNGRYFFSNIPMGLVYLIRVGDETLNAFNFYPVESSLALDVQPLACGPLVRDFGYEPSPTGGLGDFVWYDVNINGLQDEWFDANGDGLVTRNNVTATLDGNGYPTFNLNQFEFVDLNGNDKADIEGELRKCGLEATNNLLTVFGQTEQGVVDEARTGNTGYYRVRGLDRNGVYSVTIDFADSTLLAAMQAMFQTSLCKPVPGADGLAVSAAGVVAGDPVLEEFTTRAVHVGELVCGSTTPPVQRAELGASPTGIVLTADFGVVCAQSAAVGDRVWQDLDVSAAPVEQAAGDGLQNSSREPGVDGIIVQLYRERDGVLISSTVTGEGGFYLFDGLIPDDYFLVFINPFDSGVWTVANVDGNFSEAADSDADSNLPLPAGTPAGEAARTASFNLAPGEFDPSWDAGLIDITTFGISSVGDFFWHDLNKNGIQDRGEPGVAGIQATLVRANPALAAVSGSEANDTIIMTTTTNNLGLYLFTGLDAGYYFVRFALPARWQVSPRDAGTDNAFDNDVDVAGGGRTIVFYLPINTDDLTWDAGIYDDSRRDPTALDETAEPVAGQRLYLPLTVR